MPAASDGRTRGARNDNSDNRRPHIPDTTHGNREQQALLRLASLGSRWCNVTCVSVTSKAKAEEDSHVAIGLNGSRKQCDIVRRLRKFLSAKVEEAHGEGPGACHKAASSEWSSLTARSNDDCEGHRQAKPKVSGVWTTEEPHVEEVDAENSASHSAYGGYKARRAWHETGRRSETTSLERKPPSIATSSPGVKDAQGARAATTANQREPRQATRSRRHDDARS
ncbi:hypothetical protein HPB50_016537 [Hyalomma asiaticum]|uniref:Uncharacterized protein n=1 Tax=Hyalomma asiaticum TaxID=266040 RepID=A0ACB7SWX7_HYAAI|nr:hypothetical protein HPB50_016537 [Hyalomma asiaticum]